MMSRSDFRVIVAGAGPNGLTAAHMLSKAGIDFVVLERRNTCMAEVGASLALSPTTLRVYDQLDLLEQTRKIHHPLFCKHVLTHGGEEYYMQHIFEWVMENHGMRPMMMHRPDLVKMLYDELSDDAKSRILTEKDVIDIESEKDGVVVKCADGTRIKGSMIIGADGVHSQVRDAMRRLALKESPTAKVNDEKPLLTSYQCLFATAALTPSLYPGEQWGGHGPGASTQTFVGRDRVWFFVYVKLDKPTRERHRYSKADIEAYVEKWGHLAITDKLKVRDVYKSVLDCTLTDLQEGLMKVFTHDRIALVGDAVCKHTPNAGLGYNGGVQDLVVLVTQVYRLLQKQPADRAVDPEDIRAALRKYQKEREDNSRKALEGSRKVTRMQAGATWKDWMMERYIIPGLDLGKFTTQLAAKPAISEGRVLPYLREKERPEAKIPWVYYPDGEEKPKQKGLNWGKLAAGVLFVAPCFVAAPYFWFGRDVFLTTLKSLQLLK